MTTRLSVVVPAHNGEGWISRCVTCVRVASERAGVSGAEVIVVDDGSTDGTAPEAAAASTDVLPVRVISQPNLGRLAARRRGLDEARGEIVLFIDVRVELDPDALAFVLPLVDEPGAEVWTAHVRANTDVTRIAGFWQAIEHVAWRRYWRRPRRTRFGADDFDFFPKGTTALLGRREVLREAFDAYEPTVDDLRISNDDTAVLRWVAERYGINIAPEYACVYNSRTTVAEFLAHARHRGAVLIDGYLRPGARFSRAIVLVLALTPVGALVAVRRPRVIVPAAVALSVGAAGAARAGGARRDDAVVVGALAVPFGLMYVVGMWRGVAARIRARRSS